MTEPANNPELTLTLMANVDVALAILASRETHGEYLAAWVKAEHALNTMRANGMLKTAEQGQKRFERICAELGPRLTVTAIVCAAIARSGSPELQMVG